MFRSILEIITIGLPFCAFKVFTGIFLQQHWLAALGAIDLAINVTNLIALLILKKRIIDSCLFSIVVRKITKPSADKKDKYKDLGNAFDVFLSFVLVAYMIGSGRISELPPVHLQLWNLSVVLNVLGAGFGRVNQSLKQLRL